eukprot:982701-Prorocentrum_minimum.AAC.1
MPYTAHSPAAAAPLVRSPPFMYASARYVSAAWCWHRWRASLCATHRLLRAPHTAAQATSSRATRSMLTSMGTAPAWRRVT